MALTPQDDEINALLSLVEVRLPVQQGESSEFEVTYSTLSLTL